MNFTRPDEFDSYWQFAKEWLVLEPNYFEHYKYGPPKDPEEFAEMLSNYMVRHTKREVRADMPDKIMVEVRVEMVERQLKQYNQLVGTKDVLVVVDDQEMMIQNILTLITRAQQLSTDPTLLGLTGPSAKMNWVMEFIADHPKEPTIVFSRFRDPMIKLARRYDGDLVIGGGDEENGKRFIAEETDLCFCVIDAIEGVDGLQRAKHAIFIDSHWSSIKMTQALDRIDRMNIQEDKMIYLLHACREDRLVLDSYDKKMTEAELVYFYLHPE